MHKQASGSMGIESGGIFFTDMRRRYGGDYGYGVARSYLQFLDGSGWIWWRRYAYCVVLSELLPFPLSVEVANTSSSISVFGFHEACYL